jgi:uncharacterized coiled-coil protein SlyX
MSEDTRLTTIETKLMHLEGQLEDMNSVVLQQAKTITRLTMMLEDSQGDSQDMDAPAHQKPPHY